jgi:CheY-like chemotaxis protein
MDFDAQTILLAEDNEDDVFIFKRAFRQTGAKNPLQVVADGQEAMDYLTGLGKYAERAQFPLPAAVMLDLKLPRCRGLDVLQWARSQPACRRMAFVVLTSSAERRDLVRADELGARYYLVKPPRTTTLAEMLAVLRAEWRAVSQPRLAIADDLLRSLGPGDLGAPAA